MEHHQREEIRQNKMLDKKRSCKTDDFLLYLTYHVVNCEIGHKQCLDKLLENLSDTQWTAYREIHDGETLSTSLV